MSGSNMTALLRGAVARATDLASPSLELPAAAPLALARSFFQATEEKDEGGDDDDESGDPFFNGFVFVVIVLAIGAYVWISRRERRIAESHQEGAGLHSSLQEMRANIDQEVDSQIHRMSVASGRSFEATAAALPRPEGDTLNEPPPPQQVSLPGCRPSVSDSLPSASFSELSASSQEIPKRRSQSVNFAASAKRRSLSERRSLEDEGQDAASFQSAVSRSRMNRKSSIADVTEAKEELVQVMKMYGDDEVDREPARNRNSLSGWYADDKPTAPIITTARSMPLPATPLQLIKASSQRDRRRADT